MNWSPATLGQRFAALRQRKGWSIRELSRRSGVSHTHIAALELGRAASPRPRTLNDLARALGWTDATHTLSTAAMEPTPSAPAASEEVRDLRHEVEGLRALVERVITGAGVPPLALFRYGRTYGGAAARPPRLVQPEQRVLTPEEVHVLLAAGAAASDPLAPLWLCALHTGCRLGELLALRWRDVELPAQQTGHSRSGGVLVIRRTWRRDDAGQAAVSDPKSAAGVRRVPLTVPARCALLDQQRTQTEALGAMPALDALVFCSQQGSLLEESSMSHRFHRLCAAAGLGADVHVHALRHTFATTLLSQAVPLAEVSALLGHAHPAVTARVYAHALPGLGIGAIRHLETAFAPVGAETGLCGETV